MTHKKWLEDEGKEPKEEKTECTSADCSPISEVWNVEEEKFCIWWLQKEELKPIKEQISVLCLQERAFQKINCWKLNEWM